MESIIRTNTGREFPAAQAARAAAYEKLANRLAELTALDSAGNATRPVAMLLVDPFTADEIDLAERILWAQEMVNTWSAILDWRKDEDRRRGDMEACLELGNTWMWQDDRIDGGWERREDSGERREENAAADLAVVELAKGLARKFRGLRGEELPDADGRAARSAGVLKVRSGWWIGSEPDEAA